MISVRVGSAAVSCDTPRVLVAPFVHDVLFYGGFVLGVVGLACVTIGGLAIMRAKPQPQPPLPVAELAHRRRRNGAPWQIVGAFLLIGGPVASIWLWFNANHVVFVEDGASNRTPSIRRRVWIGSAYTAPRSLVEHPRRRATWIVNSSSIEVSAQDLGYGDAITSPSVAIPPGASLPVDSVNHVGPDDAPPGFVTVMRSKDVADAGIVASAHRVWLTWP